MLISSLDGKILHLKELDFIERMLFKEVVSPEDFYKAYAKFIKEFDLDKKEFWTTQELEQSDNFIKNFFAGRINESKVWILRAYVVGRFLAKTDLMGTVFEIGQVSKLPKYVLDAAKQYGLTIEEAKALQMAVEDGASLMSNTTTSTVTSIRNILIETIKQRGGSGRLLEEIRKAVVDDAGEINRDWMRVCITETNSAFNNGYLSLQKEGDYVVGMSMPDACEHCLEDINGKVYKVRKEPPPDYSNMNPDDYEKWAEVWETEVWAGKNNFGRSTSKRKRINKLLGNTEDNLREKQHHEHSMAAIPYHPFCFREDALVTLPDGTQKRIADLEIGEIVVSHKGKSQRIIGKSKREYYGNFNRIKLTNGKTIEATEGHELLIERNGEFYWAKIKEITAGDKLVKVKHKIKPSKEYLFDLYINQKLSIKRISNILSVSRDTVTRYFQEYGLHCRNTSEANYIRFEDKKERDKVVKKAHQAIAEKVKRGEWCEWFRGKKSWSSGLTKATSISMQKISDSKLGEKNPMFGKIKKETPRYINGIKSYRKYAFGIYNLAAVCERCLEDDINKLHVHHKDRDRTNNESNNLMVLCAKCHAKEHYKEREKRRNEKGQFQHI